ncbi:hypothetical protein WICMUC_004273 [Wickerhamomyces mucosus]|uniref:Guanine deaminase n=1 Tax=Wickerhamomyces mucosus TaxID=1378264 RepID=A0A9P8PHZ3_9ASCO|nr:hypothetical protein WICMUC_004273 [Wickerhamomyces mucosus]
MTLDQLTKIFYGTFIHTPSFGEVEILTKTVIGINSSGTIIFIEKNVLNLSTIILKLTDNIQNIEILDISNDPLKFFFPGFIDTHIHASQYPNNGIFGNSTLLDWLETYTFPLESSLKDLKKAELVYTKCIEKLLSNGTTCASYYATIDTNSTNLLADLCLKLGQRAFIGKICMNQNSPNYYIETFEESKLSTLKVLNHIIKIDPNKNLIQPILTPRFAPSCNSSLLNWLGELRNDKDLYLQTHLSENLKEINWVKELFPQSKTYTDVYNDFNLLSSKTILAHAIHLSNDEIELIKSKDSCISHCPISNSSITSGECRVKQLISKGIKISLGTDCSAGFSPSILQTAKHALLVSRHLSMKTENDLDKLSIKDVLYLSTNGGAKCLKLDDKLGTFDQGKQFDVQLIDLNFNNIDLFEWQLPSDKDDDEIWNNILAKWLFNGDDRNTIKVWVNGKQVYNQ